MIKSKLIRLYLSLNDSEARAFKKWVQSPIYNKHKDVQKLFEFIYSRTKITATSTHRERAFEYLYPSQKTDISRLRHVMSFSTDLLENFIRNNEEVLDAKKNEIYLLRAFRKRNLKKDAQKQEKKVRKDLETDQYKDANHYLNQYYLEQESFELAASRERPTSTNLQKLMNNNTHFFVINTLRYACTSITHQNLFKTEYNVPFLDAILLQLTQNEYSEIKSIQLYHACYLALAQPKEEEHFKKMKALIDDNPFILPPTEFRDVYNLAINYCIKRLNSGNKYYIEEAYNLYLNGLQNKILLDHDGYLSRFAFKNIIALGLNLGYFDAIKDLIPKAKNILHPDFRENYIQYNSAKYHFAIKDYKQAMQILIQTDFDDLFMNLDAKMMLLKIYVEEEEYDLLEFFLNSFSQYLRRKSIMSYHKSNYNNIIKLTRKIVHAFTKKEKESIAAEIEKTNPLTEKKWLSEILDSI